MLFYGWELKSSFFSTGVLFTTSEVKLSGPGPEAAEGKLRHPPFREGAINPQRGPHKLPRLSKLSQYCRKEKF